ncbi:MAG: GAF domain-containing sensor histidine kinase [Polyangiales bacterium]
MQTTDLAAAALLDVALRLGATRSLDALLPAVLERLVELLGAERALFALLDDDGRVEDAVSRNVVWARGEPLPISKRVVAEVLRSKEMRLVVDTDLDRELTAYESIKQHGLRFVLAVPVVACGRVAGVLWADSKAPVLAETVRRGETLKALAGVVGLAVENVLLLEEQRLRTVLVGKLVHDLKSPLLAVLLGADVLRAMGPGDDAAAVAEGVTLAGRRMRLYCDSALGFAGIETGAEPPRPARVAVPDLLDAHVRLFQQIAPEYGVTVAARAEGDLPAVETWADRVELALDNLAFNAIKYAAAGTAVTLTARRRDDAGPEGQRDRRRSAMAALFRKVPRGAPAAGSGFVELAVHNHGRPIDPALLPRIFDEWVKGDDAPRGVAATGLGLAIVEQCARSLGGRAWVESREGEGTTFRFTVPVALAGGAG